VFIKTKKKLELPETAVTPESVYQSRRAFLKSIGYGFAGATLSPSYLRGASTGFSTVRNPQYTLRELDLTPYEGVTSYNNFYEFSTDKRGPKKLANKGWNPEPWTIEVRGLVRNPIKMDVNDLIKKVGGIEQRVYRLRCVEAWSMVVPWDGFPLRKLIELVDPIADAKFVKFTSFNNPKEAPGQRKKNIDWPYVEGLTLSEAANELTLMGTGLYGKPMPNQNGAPIRLVVPWKYGFKSIKSIVDIDFTSKAPINTWQALQPREYGFFANVNPNVSHPRWSQATERIIGGRFFDSRKETLMYNGYEKEVGHLYRGLDLRKFY